MQAASLAPVVLLARQAWTEPTDRNMKDLAAATAHVPKDQLEKVVAQAVTDHAVDPNRFELVARVMWVHFLYGVGRVEVPPGEKILEYGYEYKSGGYVATNLKNNLFDPLGNHYMTNICAYMCGHKAATRAIAQDNANPKVTREFYRNAWDETEKETKQKLRAARAQGGSGAGTDQGGGC
jgi:hypothetical protein